VLQQDPAVVAALAGPLMTDPDLAAMNRGNAVIDLERFDGEPAWTRDPAEIAAALQQAQKLAGGSFPELPLGAKSTQAQPLVAGATDYAGNLPDLPETCRSAMRTGFGWAADLPRPVAIYPAGHVVEAAGTSGADCQVRAVRYVTAAAPADVLAFHFAMLTRDGYQVQRETQPQADSLDARKAGAAARVTVSRDAEGMTAVALAFKL